MHESLNFLKAASSIQTQHSLKIAGCHRRTRHLAVAHLRRTLRAKTQATLQQIKDRQALEPRQNRRLSPQPLRLQVRQAQHRQPHLQQHPQPRPHLHLQTQLFNAQAPPTAHRPAHPPPAAAPQSQSPNSPVAALKNHARSSRKRKPSGGRKRPRRSRRRMRGIGGGMRRGVGERLEGGSGVGIWGSRSGGSPRMRR